MIHGLLLYVGGFGIYPRYIELPRPKSFAPPEDRLSTARELESANKAMENALKKDDLTAWPRRMNYFTKEPSTDVKRSTRGGPPRIPATIPAQKVPRRHGPTKFFISWSCFKFCRHTCGHGRFESA